MATLPLWLADYQLLAAALLLGVMLAIAALRQPAHRLAVAKSTLAALAALAILCALPGWSLVHLLSDQPPASAVIAMPPSEPIAFAPSSATFAPPTDLKDVTVMTPATPPVAIPPIAPPPTAPIDWIALSVAAYAAGSAAVILWLIAGALLANRVRRQATPAPPELQALLQQLCGENKQAPELLISPRIAAPVAMGLRRPTVLLPLSALPLPPSQLLPILAHELAHLQHRDLHTLAATRLLLVLLWPQPLYWLLRRTIRLDQETLADAAAADRAGRLDYAQQLLAWASTASTQRSPRLAGAVGLWEGPSQLKRRIALLLNDQFEVMRTCSRRWRWLSVSCIAIVVAGLSLVTLQPITDAAEDEAALAVAAAPEVVMVRKNELLRGIVRAKNSVRGYCVDEHGKPLAGATISLYDYRSSDYAGRPHVFREALSDERGYFSIDTAIDVDQAKLDGIPVDKPFDSAKGWDAVTINAHAAGKAASYDHIPMALLVQDGDLRMFELRPGKSLRGNVTDATGGPVAGVRVTAGGYSLSSATTDANGDYEIRDLYPMDGTPGHQLNPVEFRHPDFALQKAGPATVPGTLDVTLQPGGTIEGRVEIQDGASIRPAANVDVMIARFAPLGPEETSSSRVLGTQYSRVFDREWVRTNDAGEYRMQSLAPGDHGVAIVQNDLVTNGVAPIMIKPQETTTAPPILLTRGGRIRVKLIDAETKQPIPFDKQARGAANPVFSSPTIPSMRMRRELKPYGDFGEVNVAPGKYSLFVAIPSERLTSTHDRLPTGDFPPYHEFQVEEGEELEFVVPMRANSNGHATPLRPALPPGVVIEGLDEVHELEGAPGSDAPPGAIPTATDSATKPPVAETRHRSIGQAGVFSLAGGPQKLPTFTPNAFTVRAVDAAAKPLSGIEVLLYRTSFTDGLQQQIATATTNDDGEATFSDLVPAEQINEDRESEAQNRMGNNHRPVFLVALRGPGFATAAVSKSSIDVGQRGVKRTVIMRPAAVLSGHVTDPQGKPVAGATVAAGGMANWLAIQGVNAVTTNANGEFRFDERTNFTRAPRKGRASSGSLDFKVNPSELKSDEAPLDPANDQEAASLVITHPDFAMTPAAGDQIPGEVNVQLRPAAAIRGRVVDYHSGAPAAGIPINAWGMPPLDPNKPADPGKTSAHSATTTTDAQGEYELKNLPAGRYDVWAEPPTAPYEARPWISRGASAILAIPGNAPATAPDLLVGPPPKVRVQLVHAETGEPLELKAGAHAQPYENLVGGPQFQNVSPHRVDVTPDGVFEMEATPGKLRLGVFVYDGAESYPPAYQTDDAVHAAGEVLDLRLGETHDAKLKVYSGEVLNKLRELRQVGNKLIAEKKYAEAVQAFSDILKDYPQSRDALIGRGYAYRSAGDFGRAIADFEAALALSGSDQQAEYMLADLLATSPVAGTRDGKRALGFAQRALADERNRHQYDTSGLVTMLEITAAAYAETADFASAVAAQREAIELAPKERQAELQSRLELYQSKKPYRREITSPQTQVPEEKSPDQGASRPRPLVPQSTKAVELPRGVFTPSRAVVVTNPPAGLTQLDSLDLKTPSDATWQLVPQPASIELKGGATLDDAVK